MGLNIMIDGESFYFKSATRLVAISGSRFTMFQRRDICITDTYIYMTFCKQAPECPYDIPCVEFRIHVELQVLNCVSVVVVDYNVN